METVTVEMPKYDYTTQIPSQATTAEMPQYDVVTELEEG